MDEMTEREKELEELDELKFMIKHKISNKNDIESLALWIQRAGYTKKHFPVEELEDIETKIIALGNRLDFMQDSVRRNQEMLNQAMTIHSQLLHIVRELKEE